MSDQGQIEVLVRGVCVVDGRLLVCHTKGAANTYLPGGHVDFEESATEALSREIREELGVGCEVGAFLGAVEHSFLQQGEKHCEINLVFRMASDELDASCDPGSKEDYIDFRWTPMEVLSSSDLEPAPLREIIPQWLSSSGSGAGWGSNLE